MDNISAALRRLELTDSQQMIYLSLLRQGQATPRMLADRTGLTRPSVYDQLKTLQTLNLVVELDIAGKAYFAASDIKNLDALLLDRIDRLEQSREFLTEAISTLGDSLQTVAPKIRFFEGQEGVKQLLKDLMWHDHETLRILWPGRAMAEVFDGAFLRWFDERRQKRSLDAVVIVPEVDRTIAKTHFTGAKDMITSLKKNEKIAMATIIYGSKVAYISSQAEAFGFIVESREFAQLQKLHFMKL